MTRRGAVTSAFLESCRTGDLAGLTQLLSADAVMQSDGGGKATAARAGGRRRIT
ncbi:MAG: hypothetical protein QM775_31255 [Pirellulales bacterium]